MSTATLNDDRPVDPDDELLVAYLDGELDRIARSSLEQRLLNEASLRRRLQELQRGWDLLDELPQTVPDEKWVESTLELVVADVVGQTVPCESAWARWRFPLTVAAASVLAVLVAVGGAAWLRHSRYQRQLGDLALAENYDAYAEGDDLRLMNQLHRNAEWKQTIEQAAAVGSVQPQPTFGIAGTPLQQRAERIRNLPADQRQTLAARWNRLLRTPGPQREQLRRTAAAVEAQNHSDQLLETMRRYAVWRETLPPELIDRIEGEDPSVRTQAIAEAVARTQKRIVGRSRSQLSEDAVASIYESLEQILFDRIERAGDSPRLARLRERIDGGRGEAFWLGASLGLLRGPRPPGSPERESEVDVPGEPSGDTDASGHDDQDGDQSTSDEPAGEAGGPAATAQVRGPLTADELEWVEFALPQPARDDLESLALLSPLARELALRAWAEEAIRRRFPGRDRPESAVLDRYHSLAPEQQEYFDLIPAAEWAERLSPRHPPPR